MVAFTAWKFLATFWRMGKREENNSTQDSCVVLHRGTNWAALKLTAQIGWDAVLLESYGHGYPYQYKGTYTAFFGGMT